MADRIINAILGIVLGVVLAAGYMGDIYTLDNKSDSMIQKCQQSLPRNEYCVLIAVPEGEM